MILIRHGISKWNQIIYNTGWYNIGLTQTGIQKANRLRNYFKYIEFNPKIIFTSEQKRAIDTSIAIRGSCTTKYSYGKNLATK